jgi:hypothetical protein
MPTDTPRTDAITIHPACAVTSEYSALEIHARGLERENAQLRKTMTAASKMIFDSEGQDWPAACVLLDEANK